MKLLRVKLPVGQVLLQSIIWLSLFCIVVELFARTSVGRNFFQYQSYGSSHPHFDPQVIRIKARAVQNGHIDCIFLGDSQILHGVDPSIVEQAYFEQTGRSIKCQNFGLGGLKPITASALTRLLIRNFQPSIIIYGTDLFDYTASLGGSDASIMTSPWVKYQLGAFSIDGWLIENWNSYRYYLGVDRYLLNGDENAAHIEPNGHSLKFAEKANLSQQEQIDYFDSILDRPEITEEQLNGFRGLLSLSTSEVKIIVIETPVNSTFFTLKQFSYNRKIYPDFRNILENETAHAGSELWLTQNTVQIPNDGWYDLVHLNQKGTLYFSRLLGEYLGGITFPIAE